MGKYGPPTCPNCGAELWEIGENKRMTYAFNSDYNRYEVDEVEREVYCPDCNAYIATVLRSYSVRNG